MPIPTPPPPPPPAPSQPYTLIAPLPPPPTIKTSAYISLFNIKLPLLLYTSNLKSGLSYVSSINNPVELFLSILDVLAF